MDDQTKPSNYAEPLLFADLTQYLTDREREWIKQKALKLANDMTEDNTDLWDYVSMRVEAILNGKRHQQNGRLDAILEGVDLQ